MRAGLPRPSHLTALRSRARWPCAAPRDDAGDDAKPARRQPHNWHYRMVHAPKLRWLQTFWCAVQPLERTTARGNWAQSNSLRQLPGADAILVRSAPTARCFTPARGADGPLCCRQDVLPGHVLRVQTAVVSLPLRPHREFSSTSRPRRRPPGAAAASPHPAGW